MSSKVSTSKGGVRTRSQKHQNRHKFVPNRNDTNSQADAPLAGLCGHCARVLQWRVQMKKYKPLTQPRRCNKCHMKRIKNAYHTMCRQCADAESICAKCGKDAKDIIEDDVAEDSVVDLDEREIRAKMAELPERKKRTVLRKIENGEADTIEEALDLVPGRLTRDDDDDWGFDDEDDFDGEDDDDDVAE